MPYRIATSLMLLQHGVGAFPLGQLTQRGPRFVFANTSHLPLRSAAGLESIPSLESILDDGHGHINSNLAQAVYEWEMALDGHDGGVNKQFSTRDGLRLVDELAREILSSLSGESGGDDDNVSLDDGDSNKSGVSYNDLVQEGMIALLRAMSTYDNYKSHNNNNNNNNNNKRSAKVEASTFQIYARDSIRSSFLRFLAQSGRPIRLPLSLQTTLEAANAAAEGLRRTLGREPTLVQVATEVGVEPERLALYRKLHRGTSASSRGGNSSPQFVSVEDGMEVYDPTLAGVGMGTGLRARRDLNAGDADLVDDASAEEGGAGGPTERVVAPLRDVLTDTEEINNPLSYTHHHLLNEELDQFLKQTLTDQELTVIQLRFGLVDSKHGGKGWTANEIGHRLGLAHDDVVTVASGALEKLRMASSALDDDGDAFVEVSL